MREYMDKWKKSKKYAEFQEMLVIKKQKVAELKFKVISREEEFTKKELLEIIRLIKECDQQVIDEELDFDYSFFNIVGDEDEVFIQYVGRITSWSMYLGNSILDEDYEFSSEIRDVIAIEKKQMIQLITEHRKDILLRDEDFIERISEVDVKILKKITDSILGDDSNNKEEK